MADRGPPPLLLFRAAVVLLGLAAGTLLVQALDSGLADEDRPLSAAHASWGALLAVTVMPGPLLGFFVGPGSGAKARGLAVGGCGVTAFAALLGGVFAFRRIGAAGALSVETLTTGWAALALALAAIDFLRLRGGAEAKA
jgi:hypothetical protein